MSVEKDGKGYENVSKSGHHFSKHPLTHADAEAQLRAIEANKHHVHAGGDGQGRPAGPHQSKS